MIKYNNAEIYLTRCTHPRYRNLRYVGLDTKKDPDYLGSSVTLKWWINYLGRSHFTKTILATVTGGMDACCKLEQEYILKFNAVSDPNFLNMTGGRVKLNNQDMQIDLEFLVTPISYLSKTFIGVVTSNVRPRILHWDQSRAQMVSRVISLISYGYLSYEQMDFEYNQYCDYGSCTSKDVQSVLGCLTSLGYISVTSELITISDVLIDSMPDMLHQDHFIANIRKS